MTPSRERFIRDVGALSERVGCSSGYLRSLARECGLRLGMLVRWATVFHALTLYDKHGAPWTHVAVRLGFPTHSAFSEFVRRTAGTCPSEVTEQPWALLFAMALDAAVQR